jgi:hypothetical protein
MATAPATLVAPSESTAAAPMLTLAGRSYPIRRLTTAMDVERVRAAQRQEGRRLRERFPDAAGNTEHDDWATYDALMELRAYKAVILRACCDISQPDAELPTLDEIVNADAVEVERAFLAVATLNPVLVGIIPN